MNRDGYKPMIGLMWLALPTTALNYGRVWDHLPARMAVQFDADWQPNGYTSREASLMLALGVMTLMSLVFTIAASFVHTQKPSAAWSILIVFYLALGALGIVNNWIVERNLHSQPTHSELVGSISPATSDSASRAALKLLS
jgi:hypothetical protein